MGLKQKLEYLKETVDIIKSNIEQHVTPRNARPTLRDYANLINDINQPFESVGIGDYENVFLRPGLTNASGVYHVVDDGDYRTMNTDSYINVYTTDKVYILKDTYEDASTVTIGLPCNGHASSGACFISEMPYISLHNASHIKSIKGTIINPRCLILSNRFDYSKSQILCTNEKVLYSGLCLSQSGPYASTVESPDWIVKTFDGLIASSTYEGIAVNCPDNVDIKNIYLNKININIKSMVHLFNKLIDVSNATDIYTVYLGSKNLDRLTDEQKNIAYVKGWNLA